MSANLGMRIKPARFMKGISIIELMIAMVLGLLVMAALVSLFANTGAARAELERSSRQIENGRFAVELLSDDIRMAGFFGEFDPTIVPVPGAMPDPCSLNAVDWTAAVRMGVQGYDNGTGVPGCVPGDLKPGTDVLVVRRASTCEAGVAGCPAVVGSEPYVQVSRCSPENIANPYAVAIGTPGTAPFNLTLRNCTTVAGLRRFFVRIYYVSTNNGAGENVPTLKRRDFTGTGWVDTPMVEGIEELNIEYGIDWDNDGNPNDYSTSPDTFNIAGCTSCNATNNWSNVVTARIHLLARNIEASANYTDTKTYTLGRDAAGADVEVTPGGAYRRHAYSGLSRLVNVSHRRN